MMNKKVHMTNTKKNLINSKRPSKLKHKLLHNKHMIIMKLHKLLLHSSLKDSTVYIKMLICLKKKKMSEVVHTNSHSFKHHLHNKVNFFPEWMELGLQHLSLPENNNHLKILLIYLMKVHKILVTSAIIRKTLLQVSMVLILVNQILNSNNNLRKLQMFLLLKFLIQKKLPSISEKNKQVKMPGMSLSSNLDQR